MLQSYFRLFCALTVDQGVREEKNALQLLKAPVKIPEVAQKGRLKDFSVQRGELLTGERERFLEKELTGVLSAG